MKKYFLCILVLLLLLQKKASTQNLVPNGSFESYTTCPTLTSQIYNASNWFQPNKYSGGYSSNYSSSSDYFNVCSTSAFSVGVPLNFIGYQSAHSGNAYIGLAIYTTFFSGNGGREYAEVKLSHELVANRTYKLKYYVSMANGSKFSITKFDAYFSNDSLFNISLNFMNIPVTPQITFSNRVLDTLGWVEINGSFVASGGERFLTLGNFHDEIYCDTMGTHIFNNNNCCAAYYYYDDISLEEDTITTIEELSNNNFQVYPNPSKSSISINSVQQLKEIKILDLSGKLLFQQKAKSSNETLDVSFLENGIYLLQCSFGNGAVGYNKLLLQKD